MKNLIIELAKQTIKNIKGWRTLKLYLIQTTGHQLCMDWSFKSASSYHPNKQTNKPGSFIEGRIWFRLLFLRYLLGYLPSVFYCVSFRHRLRKHCTSIQLRREKKAKFPQGIVESRKNAPGKPSPFWEAEPFFSLLKA